MSRPRLKRLRYRAWHRGTRELDLILGRFADRHLDRMNEGELDAFDELLDAADPDIQDWVMNAADVPAPVAALVARVRESLGREPEDQPT